MREGWNARRDHRTAGFRQGGARGVSRRAATRSPACSSRRRSPGARPDPLKAGGGRAQPAGRIRSSSYSAPEARAALRGLEGRSRHHGLCDAVHAAILLHPAARTARSSSIPRCCRSIAARPRSTGRSSRAGPRPASPSSGPSTGSTKGRCCCRKKSRSAPTTPSAASISTRSSRAGVAALIEAAEAVVAGPARETVQDESRATYEGWVREAEARIDWAKHVDRIYDLVRGCNPAPGAWTRWDGQAAPALRCAKDHRPHASPRCAGMKIGPGGEGRRRRASPSTPRAASSRCCAAASTTARRSRAARPASPPARCWAHDAAATPS